MLYYDLDFGAWVRKPGSSAPPWIQPVLTVGAKYTIQATFCRGAEIIAGLAGTFYAGIRIKSDYTGTIISENSDPDFTGENSVSFLMDLTTTDAKSYFTANPTENTVQAVLVIAATIDDDEIKTSPFEITLQNDYFPEA